MLFFFFPGIFRVRSLTLIYAQHNSRFERQLLQQISARIAQPVPGAPYLPKSASNMSNHWPEAQLNQLLNGLGEHAVSEGSYLYGQSSEKVPGFVLSLISEKHYLTLSFSPLQYSRPRFWVIVFQTSSLLQEAKRPFTVPCQQRGSWMANPFGPSRPPG